MNKLVKQVTKANLCDEFLNCLNGILGLTGRELLLLEKLVQIDLNASKTADTVKNVISTENRRLIKEELGITPDNLSRYISKFKEKGILVRGKFEDEYVVNKALIPEIIGDRIQITIVLRINEREND